MIPQYIESLYNSIRLHSWIICQFRVFQHNSLLLHMQIMNNIYASADSGVLLINILRFWFILEIKGAWLGITFSIDNMLKFLVFPFSKYFKFVQVPHNILSYLKLISFSTLMLVYKIWVIKYRVEPFHPHQDNSLSLKPSINVSWPRPVSVPPLRFGAVVTK